MGTQEAGSTLYNHKKHPTILHFYIFSQSVIWEKMAFIRKIKHFPKEDFIFQCSTCSHKRGCKLKCLNLSKGLISQSVLQPLLEK